MQNTSGFIPVSPALGDPAVSGWMISRGPFQLQLFCDSTLRGVPEQISLGGINVLSLITESLVTLLPVVPVKQVFGQHFPRASDVFMLYIIKINVMWIGDYFGWFFLSSKTCYRAGGTSVVLDEMTDGCSECSLKKYYSEALWDAYF